LYLANVILADSFNYQYCSLGALSVTERTWKTLGDQHSLTDRSLNWLIGILSPVGLLFSHYVLLLGLLLHLTLVTVP